MVCREGRKLSSRLRRDRSSSRRCQRSMRPSAVTGFSSVLSMGSSSGPGMGGSGRSPGVSRGVRGSVWAEGEARGRIWAMRARRISIAMRNFSSWVCVSAMRAVSRACSKAAAGRWVISVVSKRTSSREVSALRTSVTSVSSRELKVRSWIQAPPKQCPCWRITTGFRPTASSAEANRRVVSRQVASPESRIVEGRRVF